MKRINMRRLRFGYKLGVAFLFVALVFVCINVLVIKYSNRFYPKYLAAAPMFLLASITFFLFPGPDTVVSDDNDNLDDAKLWFQNAGLTNKLVWGFSIVLMIAIAVVCLTYQLPIVRWIKSF